MSLLSRSTQLRFRRIFRRRRKQVESATTSVGKQLDTNFIGRFYRLRRVRGFAVSWIAAIVIITFGTVLQTLALSSYYQRVQPTTGGIYNEGIVGTYSNANPIFATGSVDTAVSRLVFAGLLKYNNHNQLTGDLASGYSVDQTGKHYVVKLRPGLVWQDGQPLTAKDVAFTFHLIQNPDVGSPLIAGWQNIVVTAVNPTTIHFDLPNPFSAFPYSLVTGIVPEHSLKNVPIDQLRSTAFNTTQLVGAGPFAWQAIESDNNPDPDKAVSLLALKPFQRYAHGAPKLAGFVIHTFGSNDQMVSAFQKRTINAMAGLITLPASLRGASDVTATSFASTAADMTFFKTSSGVLADVHVRQALVQGADTNRIIDNLGYPATPVDEPLLHGQLAYDSTYKQAAFDPAAASATLEADGWLKRPDGFRYKDGKQLTFRLYAEDTAENSRTTRLLAQNWRSIGVNAVTVLQLPSDFQTTVEFHTYDALLYGISIGVDPDVFAYWDSSQADIRSATRLNFSEYSSATADASLESGRTRLDPQLRTIKYQPFLKSWQTDAPALGLYQPRFLYITRGAVYGLQSHTLNSDVDRYGSVANWEIRTAKVTNR